MEYKTCRNPECPENNPQPVESFHRDRTYSSGRKARCTTCRSVTARKFFMSPKGKAYRASRRDIHLKRQLAYQKTERGKEINHRAVKRHYYKHKHKYKAKYAIKKAVDSGILPKVSKCICITCLQSAEHYHHHLGYSQEHWLDVIPVCQRCHIKIHNDELILIREYAILLPTGPPVPLA